MRKRTGNGANAQDQLILPKAAQRKGMDEFDRTGGSRNP